MIHASVKGQNNFWVSTGFHWFSSFQKLGNWKARNPHQQYGNLVSGFRQFSLVFWFPETWET